MDKSSGVAKSGWQPAQLRRLKVFADMTDAQLGCLLEAVEPVQVKARDLVVRMGTPGDCMFLLVAGEVRVRQIAQGRETQLATLETGDFFGDVCLFDEGPRSADVVAVRDCTLFKLSKTAFDGLLATHPDIIARLLVAMIRLVEGRVRAMNKKYVDSMLLSRSWNPGL